MTLKQLSETMLRELQRHNKLGNKKEITHFLFNGASKSILSRKEIKVHLCSSMFSIGHSFDGIVALCSYCSLIIEEGEYLQANLSNFNPKEFKIDSYLNQYHFYEKVFFALNENKVLSNFINEESLKFSSKTNQFYLLEDKVPYRFFSIKNMFIGCDFLRRDETRSNQLFINERFTEEFKNDVIRIKHQHIKGKKTVTINQLKQSLLAKEKVGLEAENFVFNFEISRLRGHSNIDLVRRISDHDTGAGYDINSFNDLSSVFVNRFIEVKSYRDTISFYWSKNELNTAKKLGEKYFLYLVDRSKQHNSDYIPKIFQNPYKKIFESEIWMKEIENWKISLTD